MTLLACCGGGALALVLYLPILLVPFWAMRISAYYLACCELADAHPELRRTPSSLMTARLCWGITTTLTVMLPALLLTRSWVGFLAAVFLARMVAWACYERVVIVPHVQMTTREQILWPAAATAGSLLLDTLTGIVLWWVLLRR
jgi:hypothetical protein